MGDVTSSDLAINGGKTTKDNVVVYGKDNLLHPVPPELWKAKAGSPC